MKLFAMLCAPLAWLFCGEWMALFARGLYAAECNHGNELYWAKPSNAVYFQGWSIWIDPYKLFIRPLLFLLDAETAAHFTIWALVWVPAWIIRLVSEERQVLP